MDKKELLKKRNASKAVREVVLDPIEPGDEPITVTVRALTRAEIKECSGLTNAKSERDLDKVNPTQSEINMIATALIDPVMTPEEVAEWVKDAPGGDSTRIMEAVSDLSGMGENTSKRNLQNVRGRG